MNWSDVLLNATVQAMLLAVLAFLARSVLLHWLEKDVAVFKAGLSATAERTLEELKAQLARDAAEHQVRFQSLHAKRVEAIEAVYVRLVAARYTMEAFVNAWRPKDAGEFQGVAREFWELRRELDTKRIYLPEPLCAELTKCIQVMWSPAVQAHVWPSVTRAEYATNASEAFLQAQQAILEGGAVVVAIENLEREFRKVLGAG
jgi:hypothetical protein